MSAASHPEYPSIASHATCDRRAFLKVVGSGAVAASSAAIVSACGGTSSGTAATTHTLTPKRGGTLNAAITGGGSSDTLNPFKAVLNTDFARVNQLFEPLVRYDEQAQPQLWLAEELTPNKDFTVWTVRVRPGVTFHNGKPLTAADVAYTMQSAVDPKVASSGASLLPTLDASALKIRDSRTVDVPFKAPFAIFPEVLPAYWFNIVPENGLNPTHPVGTGPFRFKSFVPGQESVFLRNDSYWRSGLPYLDSIAITDFADETSQLDALNSGQADVANALSGSSITIVQSSGGRVSKVNGASFSCFVMNCSSGPCKDVRVRQALRALVGREEMRQEVFYGNGLLGNDVFGIADRAYDHSLPQRQQDITLAKSLLRQAGQEGATIQLFNADVGPGLILMGQVLARQAQAAGVNIGIRQITTTELFGPNYTHWPFTVDYWYYLNYLPMALDTTLTTSSQPETRFSNPRYDALCAQALAAPDPLRTEIAHEMQRIDYDEGGYIIPFFLPTISGIGQKVYGTRSSLTGVDFANFDFSTTWKA